VEQITKIAAARNLKAEIGPTNEAIFRGFRSKVNGSRPRPFYFCAGALLQPENVLRPISEKVILAKIITLHRFIGFESGY
jgi:hypothetical protein